MALSRAADRLIPSRGLRRKTPLFPLRKGVAPANWGRHSAVALRACSLHIALLDRELCEARPVTPQGKECAMSLGTILIIVLILILLGVLPTWPHSRQWGYAPSGIVGTLLLILIVLFLLGRL